MPLVLPNDDDCSFCAYLSGERPYTIVGRGPLTALLVTYEQRGLGHVLAIPVAHRVTLFDLNDAEAAALTQTTLQAATAIQRAFDPEGIVVWQNNGVPAHQSVPHMHVHVAGTIPDGRTIDGPVERLAKHDTDLIADRLRSHVESLP